MKKVTILFFMSCVMIMSAHAQEFKKFKVGIGVGYAKASGSGSKGGVLATIEPAYRITDAIQVGLRWESAAIVRGFSEDVEDLDLDVAAIGSFSLNGQYYFSNEGFRPFVGAGVGLFTLAAIKVDGDESFEAAASQNKVGFYPRVGFDAGHFTLALDYNIIPATKTDFGGDFKNSYLGIRIGAFFGGGRK